MFLFRKKKSADSLFHTYNVTICIQWGRRKNALSKYLLITLYIYNQYQLVFFLFFPFLFFISLSFFSFYLKLICKYTFLVRFGYNYYISDICFTSFFSSQYSFGKFKSKVYAFLYGYLMVQWIKSRISKIINNIFMCVAYG